MSTKAKPAHETALRYIREAETPPQKASVSDFNAGVWFQSAASGLWYEVKNAAGGISVKIDGATYIREAEKESTCQTTKK